MGSSYVSIGEMTSSGTLYYNAGLTTSTGGAEDIPSTVGGTVRGKLEKVRSHRTLGAGLHQIYRTYSWTCYYQNEIEDVLSKHLRWVIDGKNYTVIDFEILEHNKNKQVKYLLTEDEVSQ